MLICWPLRAAASLWRCQSLGRVYLSLAGDRIYSLSVSSSTESPRKSLVQAAVFLLLQTVIVFVRERYNLLAYYAIVLFPRCAYFTDVSEHVREYSL